MFTKYKVILFGSDRSPRRGNLGSVSVYFIDSSFVGAFKQCNYCGKGAGRVLGRIWEGESLSKRAQERARESVQERSQERELKKEL